MRIYFKDLAEFHQTLDALGLANTDGGRMSLLHAFMADCRDDAFGDTVAAAPDIFMLESEAEEHAIDAHDVAQDLPEDYVEYTSYAIDENNRPFMTVRIL